MKSQSSGDEDIKNLMAELKQELNIITERVDDKLRDMTNRYPKIKLKR